MKTYLLKPGVRQAIAKAGETGVAVAYNATAWINDYPSGVPQLMVTRPNGQRVPVTVAVADNLIAGQVPDDLLVNPGMYSYVFAWTSGATQLESGNCECIVLGSDLAKTWADVRRAPDWAERIFLAAGVIEGTIDGALELRNAAVEAMQRAEDARDDAVSAKEAAEIAKGKAEDAQEAAEAVAESIPEEYSQLSGNVGNLRSALNDVAGALLIEGWEENKRISTTGETITFERVANTSYTCIVVNCDEGDVFTMSATADSASYRIYCFCQDDGTVVEKPSSNLSWDNRIITAPTGATKLVCNSLKESAHKVYKGVFATGQLNEEIKGSMVTAANSDLWENGSFVPANGNEATSGAVIRTKEAISYLCRVKTTSPYEFALFAWDAVSGTYIGTLQRDGTYAQASPFYREDCAVDPTNGYVYRVLMKNKSSGTMSAAEGENCSVSTALPMIIRDEIDKIGDDIDGISGQLETFGTDVNNAIKGMLETAASADLWEIGSFVTDTGAEHPGTENKRIRTKEKTTNLFSVKTTSAYEFALYAWTADGTYVGTLKNNGTYAPTTPDYFSEIMLDPTDGYSYRILLKKTDGTAFEDATDGANVSISTSLPMNNRDEIGTIGFLVPKPFPVDGLMQDAEAFYGSFDALADWQKITDSEYYEYGYIDGGYVDSHIENYQNYKLRAYYLNGRKKYLGFSSGSSNGYSILSPYTGDDYNSYYGTGLYQRKKVMIVSGMHGKEKAPPNILREFVRNLIYNPEYADLLTAYEFCFVPLANPYGYTNNQRTCEYYDSDAGELVQKDMNGDFPQDGSEQTLNESKFVKQTFLDGEYDLVIDLHQHELESGAGVVKKQMAFAGITLPPDSTISAGKYFRTIAGSAIYAQNEIRSIFNIENNEQTMMPWDRDTSSVDPPTCTFREYAVATRDTATRHKADLAAISETSTTCYLYSGTKTKYNQISMTVCSVFNNRFISDLLRRFMDE